MCKLRNERFLAGRADGVAPAGRVEPVVFVICPEAPNGATSVVHPSRWGVSSKLHGQRRRQRKVV
jgi:hypothetical protein